MSKEIIEGLKEVARTALMALVPLIIAQLSTGTIDWKAICIAGAIALLSGVDKWLHKSDIGVNKNGLTGF